MRVLLCLQAQASRIRVAETYNTNSCWPKAFDQQASAPEPSGLDLVQTHVICAWNHLEPFVIMDFPSTSRIIFNAPYMYE